MEREAAYLLRRELQARRMAQAARSKRARKAHRALACSYAARRVAMGSCSLAEGVAQAPVLHVKIWLGAGMATVLMIAATYLQPG